MPEDITQPSPRSGLDGGDDGSAQAKAAEIAGQAQNTAQQAAGQAQEKLREQLNQRSSQAAAKITEQAADMRSVSETLRDQGKHGPARAADRIAGYADSVGEYLRDKDSDQLLADVEDFGRRQPWAIAAGGLTLGFIASRFLKASSSRRYQTRTAPAQPEQMNRPPSPSAGNGVGAEMPPNSGHTRRGAGRLAMATYDSDNGLREQPMGELFKQLSTEISTLVRQELTLAQAEMTQKGKRAGTGAGMFGGAGILALLALMTFTACLVAALATGMDVWLAALIVTIVYGALAGALALLGKNKVAEATPPVPEQTVESVKEDVQWAKTRMPSGRK